MLDSQLLDKMKKEWLLPSPSTQYPNPMSSIISDVEIETHLCSSYPSIEEFLINLERAEPRRQWVKKFLGPVTSMGVRTLDDMEIVSPESLTIFHKLCPLMVMDFFVHVINSLDEIHARDSICIP
jgi:hypothetical protein